MYAILRRYAYDPTRLDDAAKVLVEVRTLHEGQVGYAGSLVIDDGQHWIAVNLWQTEQAAAAGREAIGAEVQRLFAPLMVSAPELLAVGEVITDDATTAS